jgi:nucleoside-diphosphate-sugar epimerase
MGLHIAVIGASGLFGRALVQAFTDTSHTVTPVTRSTYDSSRSAAYDVVINSAMPSKRFWARQHPDQDFIETVGRTADLLYGWRFKKFVQISSLSARCERDTVYGRHKAAAEVLCDRQDALVVRLTSLYGPDMTKGVILDIVNHAPVFVASDSAYAFTPVAFAAAWVASHLDAAGIVEVGARDTVRVHEIAEALGRQVTFSGPREHQKVQHPDATWPSAREVLAFAADLATTQGRDRHV